MDTSAKVNRARLPKVAQPISEHQSLRRVFDPTPISCANSHSSFIRQPSLVYKWPLARICCVPLSAYPAAIRGDLMRCADPERIATLAADHRNFGRQLPRERMCGAKDRTCLPACGWERVIDFNG